MLPCRAATLKGLGNSRLEATDETPADFAGAAEAFEEAVSLDPNDEELPGLAAGALKEVGKAQMAAGDDAEPDFRAAAATFAKAAAIDPRYPRPRTHHSHPGPAALLRIHRPFPALYVLILNPECVRVQ